MRNLKNVRACRNKFLRQCMSKYVRNGQRTNAYNAVYQRGMTILAKDEMAAYIKKYSLELFMKPLMGDYNEN